MSLHVFARTAILSRLVLSACLTITLLLPALAQGKEQRRPNLIRDAEIEGYLRTISRPIYKSAGIDPGNVHVYVIAEDNINAFVAGGQRIFINTGLFTRTKSPDELIGVIAHETGHIAGGHLAKLKNEMARASTERIIGMLVGVAATVGGAATGNAGAAQAGQGILLGSQSIAQRNFLSYQRSMEAAADQAALKFLYAARQDPQGMLTLFQKLANDSIASTSQADPYLFSHPMPLERIRNLEVLAKQSPYYGKADDPAQVLRYELIKAKLMGYLQSPQRVFQRYPSSDPSLESRYARSIAMYRRGDIRNALPLLDSLTSDVPQNPYFWELKAQALLENGQAARGLPAIEKARKLLPNNGLLQLLHAQILLATNDPASAGQALKLLVLARQTEGEAPVIFKYEAQAHALKGDLARADLATAEYYWQTGEKPLAIEKARKAQARFKKGTREWLRANDLLTFAQNKG